MVVQDESNQPCRHGLSEKDGVIPTKDEALDFPQWTKLPLFD